MLTSKNMESTDNSTLDTENSSSLKKVRFQLDPDHELRPRNKVSKISKPNNSHGVSPHPIGIKPLGNFYLRDSCNADEISWRHRTLGFFNMLTDEMILKIFEYFKPEEIIKLSSVSKGFYAFSYFDDSWKELVIDEFNGDFDFKGSWRLTYIHKAFPESFPLDIKPFSVSISGFYSDVLFQPWLCASTGITPFIGKENIDRRSNLSLEDFIREYEILNKPVIITDVIQNWAASKTWTEEKLVELYGEVKFRAEAIDISLRRYFEYSHQNLDESPVYLFDKKFGDNCPGMLSDFEVPIYFRDDLFQLLGNDRRPDYRWLIIGPARSGSTFHKDPNATSAWNAVITGSKKWIMFPPNCPPPGVYTNKDESEVTSPVSIMDWHLNYYQEAVTEMETKPIEAICRAGEIMFVPSGWWHLVVNLEDSIALTQNYVSHQNAESVLNFMYHKPDQVSGWRFDPFCTMEQDTASMEDLDRQTLFDAFSEKYQDLNPELVARVKSTQSKADPTPSFWEKLTTQDQVGFQFGFCASDIESDE